MKTNSQKSPRRGSRLYTLYTFHSQREPKDMIYEKRASYRRAQKFLDRWQKVYENSSVTDIKRTRTRVEGSADGGQTTIAAYFKEHKEV